MIRIKSLKLIRLLDLVKGSKTEIVIGGKKQQIIIDMNLIPKTSKIKLLLGLLVENPK